MTPIERDRARGLGQSRLGRRAAGLYATPFLFVLAFSGLAFVSVRRALADEQNGVSNELVEFDIPEQPLAAALERFMSLSNVTIVVDSAIIGARRSSAVRGALSPDGALQSLLEGTGLDSQRIGQGAYTLAPLPLNAEARLRLPRYMDYAAAVQRAVMAALCRADDTSPIRYRAVIRLWLNPDGKAKLAELAVSTGNPGRDTAITAVLGRVEVGLPVPSNLPQPVKLAIAPRGSDDATCSPDRASVGPAPRRGVSVP
jgi:hypothetical protein